MLWDQSSFSDCVRGSVLGCSCICPLVQSVDSLESAK